MIYTSLAVVVLSASTAVSPFTHLVHLHAHAARMDHRISITLHNSATMFQDIKVDDHSYTIWPHQGIVVKAPAGTIVYSDSSNNHSRRGEKLVELTRAVDNQSIDLK